MPIDYSDPLALIKAEEGFAPRAKWDYRQYSGGYGSRAAPGEVFSPAKAESYLRRDAAPVIDWVNRFVPNASPQQRAALVSFGYNLGTDDLDKLRPDIQAGNWARVATRMRSFNRAGGEVLPGLVARRGREAALIGGAPSDPASMMAQSLRQRFGTKTEGGVMPSAQPAAASGAGMDRLKSALTKSYDPDRLSTAETLAASGQKIAGSSGNALGAIGGTILAGLGGYQRSQEADARKAHDAEFSRLAGEASNTEGLMNVMLSSSDPKMREAGVELKAKLLTPQQPVEINGRLVQKQADGSYKEVYASPPKPQGPIEVGGRIVQQQPDGSFKEVYAAPPKPSAPVVTEVYDAEGRKQKAVVQPDTGEFKPIGGAAAADAATKLGLNPQQYVDKDGNLVYTQLSEAGGRKDVELPEGARWAPGYDIKDTGTALTGINKRTGEVGPVVPKDVAGKERLEEIGKGQGQAQVDLPRVESNTESMLAQIDATRSDPYLPSMTGPFDTWRPNLSGDAARVQSKVDQLGGQAFLQAFQSLKGGGQITELEGAKATAALARLQNMGVNDADYLKALDDFKGEVIRLRDLARQRAGGGSSSAPPPSSPSGGNTRLRFNPATGELE